MTDTPFFLIEKSLLDDNLKGLKKALDTYWPNNIIAYSFKTNSLPWILEYFKENGCYGEVVSSTEYQLARQMGYSKEKIVFNGPIKGKEEFEDAILNGGLVNIDSERELEWLDELNRKSLTGIKTGVRVNFDLESMCPGEIGYEDDGTRFGFCYENGQLKHVLERLQKNGIKISGIHLHTTSKTRSLNVYHNIAQKALEIINMYHLTLDYIDIGGGFFGGVEGKPSFDDYIRVIRAALENKVDIEKVKLIVEPGSALVGSPVSFFTKVIDVKDTKKSRIITIDGSRTNIDPLMIKKTYYHAAFPAGRKKVEKQIITGFTCMDRDRLMTLHNEGELLRGDLIVFEKVGAYTLALNPLFINYFPAVYVRENGSLKKVREEWGVKEFLGDINKE